MKASVFIAVSLDGFIARANGDVDWLDDLAPIEEDHGFDEFFKSVDYLVIGRNSFDKVLSFGTWPYGTRPVIVLTTRPLDILDELADSVEVMCGCPEEICEELSGRGAQHLYVDGGLTIQAFLNAGLIDQLITSRIPILLGGGIPLFGPLQREIKLSLVETKSFANGIVQSEYEVSKW